jgi:hypothetical protein
MAIASQEPNPGRKRGVQRWTYLRLPNGQKTVGFLAGFPFGVYCHHHFHDLPCRAKASDGRLACKLCEALGEPIWRGFTPYYDAEYLPCFTIITDDYLESVRELGPFQMVEMSRAAAKKSPVVIRPKLWRTQPIPPSPGRVFPVNLADFLFGILWKDAELQRYHVSAALKASDKALSQPAVPPSVGMVPNPDAALDAATRRLKERAGKLETLGEVLAAPNGKHKRG